MLRVSEFAKIINQKSENDKLPKDLKISDRDKDFFDICREAQTIENKDHHNYSFLRPNEKEEKTTCSNKRS